MSLKVKYLDRRQIKNLLIDIQYIASDELKQTIKEYVEYEPHKGEYLINILNETQIRELENLNKNYKILTLIK